MGSARTEPELSPPQFLQLAAHPCRWQLLGELARSDRMVSELTALLGQPQNLVSYHLGKLRESRLVSARRSTADGRDSYYVADLPRLRALLAATGAALHPGLDPGLDHRPGTSRDRDIDGRADRQEAQRDERPPTARVLFLCTGNSSRSQLAEALARARSHGRVEAFSAGSRPKPIHPNTLRVLEELGIDAAEQQPTHLDAFTDERFDRVVTLCDRLREVCPEFPGEPETIHWSIPDPSLTGDDDEATYPAFQRTAAELETRIGFLLRGMGIPQPPVPAAVQAIPGGTT